jgi:DNA-binding Lrp family transcriptional regulator
VKGSRVAINGRDARTVDAIDRAIITELQSDPRATVMAMSSVVGISRQNAQSRLNRMIEERIVRVCGLVDPAVLGRPLLAKLFITMSSSPKQLASVLSTDARTNWVTLLSTGNAIMTTISVATPQDVSDFVDDVVRTQTGVDSVTVDMITAVFTPLAEGGAREAWLGGRSQAVLDDIDLAIVEEMRLDGRVSFTRLAKASGLSTASARQRALRLIDSGVVRLHALPNPDAFGLSARAEAHVRVTRNSADLVRDLASLPHARLACRVVGTSDVHAEFYAESDEHLLESVAQLGRLPGVASWRYHRYEEVVFANPLWA